MANPENNSIRVRGAREHNLRGVDLAIPRGSFTVVSGVSGSGKSSLAFDTLFREGQRRYLASLSPHAQAFLDRQHRPAADGFDGLPPTLAVDQRTTIRNPRSTVGTLSEIYDYLRLLYARIGTRPDGCPTIGTHTFSFNTDQGACPTCNGLAVVDRIDPDLLIHDPTRTLRGGALVPTTKSGYIVYSQVTIDVLNDVCRAHGFDVDTPWQDLTDEHRQVIFYGSERLKVPFGKHPLESRMKWSGITARPREEGYYKGLLPTMEATLARDRNKNILRFVRSVPCTSCDGTRLSDLARSITIAGLDLGQLVQLPLANLRDTLASWKLSGPPAAVAAPILAGIDERLERLLDLGLAHLELGRDSTTLSGGEAQRIRLANQVGSRLQGLLYVLDEPSIGLHRSETDRLLRVLGDLRDQGNTILCVEHDGPTIAAADHAVELGPGAGTNGGQLLYSGAVDAMTSPTGEWLHAPRVLHDLARRRPGTGILTVRNARAHNLRGIDVPFHRGALNVVSGVSGAGKSTLVDHILARALRQRLHNATATPGEHDGIDGADAFTKIVHVDASPIGRTPRSNPATYTGVFDAIRNLFAGLEEAKANGMGKSHFSTNVAGGRCTTCQGAGHLVVGMHGLADVEVPCPECGGKRFDPPTLAIKYRGHSIADVLAMTVGDALEVFADEPKIEVVLRTLATLGLDYITLGQSATTLSGGEAQRVKLATELARPPARGETLFVLDEPTTGLHAEDVRKLIATLSASIDAGHTAVLIEHDLEILACADHVIDLGPGAGAAGGDLVFAGPPDALAECEASRTGAALAEFQATGYARATAEPERQAPADTIELRGVRTHNLQGIDVSIPHRALTAIVGVSGSGKSSLAFDTIFAEGRRRYAENLTTQARRHLAQQATAQFDAITGLAPAIALRPHRAAPNRRSTVGTLSGVLDPMRLLFSRAGSPRGSLLAQHFSFNQPEGACPACGGTGIEERCDPAKLVTDPTRSLFDGAMDGTKTGRYYGERNGQHVAILKAVAAELALDLDQPVEALDEAALQVAMFGCGEREFDVVWEFERKGRTGDHEFRTTFAGFANYVDEEYQRKKDDRRGDAMRPLLSANACPTCRGDRLREEARAVTVSGQTLAALSRLTVTKLLEFVDDLTAAPTDASLRAIAAQPAAGMRDILARMVELGLGYLSLDRETATLSGGEVQRVRLAAQLATPQFGVTYVLDEPTTGLHPRDTDRLLRNLRNLCSDNTVIVVEHDPMVWAAADHVVALGPGAGPDGGRIVAANSEASQATPRPSRPRPDSARITIRGATAHNLTDIDAELPTGCLVAITGVSGSGKTTLAFEVLAASATRAAPVGCRAFESPEFATVITVSDLALPATPLSMPATVLGILDRIRKLFAGTEDARAAGLPPSAFSLTTKSKNGAGRCAACAGHGAIRTRMDFLADIWHPCESCQGKRFGPTTLSCRYEAHTIADVLAMRLTEARETFAAEPRITAPLDTAIGLGLGHLTLGRPANTLSGGENQRLKLAADLGALPRRGRSLILLDEPTRGLHPTDVAPLLAELYRLTERGHSVIAVEHNLSVVRGADWVLDLGPEAGPEGGTLLYQGPVDGFAECTRSETARYL